MKKCCKKVYDFFSEHHQSPYMILLIIGGIAAFAFVAIRCRRKRKDRRHDINDSKKMLKRKESVKNVKKEE